ncbi:MULTISPECIES: TIGR00282 family metallophosphoesterase [unclassified Facklamia]|uniref:TIGR00282 family metallophosphoesterase n=1 Tax=Aerococcaceae TaxID=186827 RepID=UPI0013BD42F4|nr:MULTISPECIES: TIGR00282 family metallophosphoesterase [unclassified Facklamia]NEW64301.1 TIGR00282 family metallophosphoesterase [Facklamia sp. 252]NEW67862.1 TIGR00282 family metallophosphoesterase [Facklamia sp. 253]QQD64766.1 TIGR00282 family metallophosphoesterase [Aerococcaceae bacterium zg-252]
MRLLFIGDVVGKKGQEALSQYLPQLKQNYRPQVTIVNGENIDNGKGISEKWYKWLLSTGADVVTLGNHAWDNREIYDFIESAKSLVRPINLPEGTPGKGVHFIKVNQYELAVINALGSVFMGSCIEPFNYFQEKISEIRQRTPFIFVDFHAEATSEKQALGYFLDGEVSAVVGTHTHVQTNDARILPQGTGFMTDVGMTGAMESVIGFNPQQVVNKFKTHLPTRLEQSMSDSMVISGCFIELDPKTGRCLSIEPIYLTNATKTKRYRHV